MLKNKFVMFNGPPRSGKDTAVNHLIDNNVLNINLKFAKEVKERTHALYGLFGDNGKVLPHDYFEKRKDQELPEFMGITPRDAYINTSEKLMKPVHGNGVWAKFLTDYISDFDTFFNNMNIGISDVGFDEEIAHFIEEYGVENILLFRIFREDCSYENDSRKYVKVLHEDGTPVYKGLQYFDMINADLYAFLNSVQSYTEIFLQENRLINKYY